MSRQDDNELPVSSGYDLSDYWLILVRRRWMLGVPAFLLWLLVWIGSWFIPASYRSETLILIDSQKVPEQYVVSNIVADFQERLQSMTQQILSRTRLLRVIEEANLYSELRKKATTDEVIERMRKDVQIELVQAPTRRQDVSAFKIYYTASTPQLAQRVTGELTQIFINENLRARQEQSQNTTEFLQVQLEEARKRLAEQESLVRDFKSRYPGELPGQLASNLQILGGLQAQLQAQLSELNRAKEQNLYLKSVLGQYRSIQAQLRSGSGGDAPAAIDQELSQLKSRLNELRARYTEDHPDIQKLRQQIATTEKMKDQLDADILAASSSLPANDTPKTKTVGDLRTASPIIEVEGQLKANELDLANRQEQVRRLTNQVAMYESRLNQTPVREQQMAALTRDYEQSRANYESLLAKKNQSELATNLERQQQGEQFRMVDPPSLPQKPFSPNRLKLSMIGLMLGGLVGLLLTVSLEFGSGVIRREDQVREIVPPCIVETIPRIPTLAETQHWRSRLWIEVVAGSSMLATLAIAMLYTYKRG